MRRDIVRLQLQGPAVAGDRLVQLPWPSGHCRDCCGPRRSPASIPGPGGSRPIASSNFPWSSQGRCRGCCGPRHSPVQFQGPAEAGDRLVQLPLGLQGDAEVVVGFGESRSRVAKPGGSRRSPRLASPGRSGRCRGCCRPRRSPASVPRPGGSRPPPRPVPLLRKTALPRLLWASARSGLSAAARRKQSTLPRRGSELGLHARPADARPGADSARPGGSAGRVSAA